MLLKQFRPSTPEQKAHVASCGRFLLSRFCSNRYRDFEIVLLLLQLGADPNEPDAKNGWPFLPKAFGELERMALGLDEVPPERYSYYLTELGAMIACMTCVLRAGADPELHHQDCRDGKSFIDFLQETWKGPDRFMKFALKTAFSIEEKADGDNELKRVVRCHLPNDLEAWVYGDWSSKSSVIRAWVQGWSSELSGDVKEKAVPGWFRAWDAISPPGPGVN